MPRKSNTRAAKGAGSIRKRADGTWEARFVVGHDPGSGKQIRKSVYGKTQKEVREKLTKVTSEIDANDYSEPTRITLKQWLDIWQKEYLNSVKPRTRDSYKSNIEKHIAPALGAIKLQDLNALQIQHFYNGLTNKITGLPLSAKSKANIHGTLHKALEQAKKLGYIRSNPADKPDLPKIQRAEIKPLDDCEIGTFLKVINGHPFEPVYLVTLFTGMREGEVLGLTWDCVDFDNKAIIIKQQLQMERGSNGKYSLVPTKNGKSRTITPARFVMDVLKKERTSQIENRLMAGDAWDNPFNLVFTNAFGSNLCAQTVYHNFKKLAAAAGVPDARFHDLRHSYAVAALRSGDDIKTVQSNLGHHTAAFTLDTYAHVTEQMKRESASRMDKFIESVKEA